MKYPPFSSSVLPFFRVLIFFVIKFADPLSQISSSYSDCSSFFHCGNFTNISYPFWGGSRPKNCGHPELSLNCNNNITTIQIMNVNYQVLDMNPATQMLKIARQDLKDGICLSQILNTSLNSELFEYGDGYGNITLVYGCEPVPFPALGEFSCPGRGTGYLRLGDVVDSTACEKRMLIPVRSDLSVNPWNVSEVEEAIGEGFEVKLKVDTQICVDCIKSNGICGFDWKNNQPTPTCFCRNDVADYLAGPCSPPPPPPPPPANTEKKNQLPLKIGMGAGGAAILCLFLGCVLYVAKRRKEHKMQEKHVSLPHFSNGVSNPTTNLSQSIPSFPYSKSDLESGSSNYGVQVFNYMELEEATKNFDPSRELGEGGFGTVYYGKLSDGREVAVKRLYENNLRRAEQFKNELEILTRLHHTNLVKLYGSTSRRSQELLLVYEYVPNGTVADHLHGKQANSKLLNWYLRLRIALETADALAYLHHSDIIHRDVKTNNILLDDHFQVKVADFGLSRLFPTNVTHVSTAPQGTPGYVDPEYYQVYQLTDKSDVFSFGVVLIELISSLEAVDMSRHRHDINLSNMALNKIQRGALHELVDPNLGFETDLYVRRMITSVSELAFRCLQQDKEMRPSMDEVLVILKGIENKESGTRQAEVVDISGDDVQLLKNTPPPLSPDSVTTDKLASTTTTDGSF